MRCGFTRLTGPTPGPVTSVDWSGRRFLPDRPRRRRARGLRRELLMLLIMLGAVALGFVIPLMGVEFALFT